LDGAKETLAAADVAIIPDESTPIESEDSNLDRVKEPLAAADAEVAKISGELVSVESEDSNLDKLEETILAASVESEVVRDKPEDADN